MKDVLLIIASSSDKEQIEPGIHILKEKKMSYELATC